MKESSNDTKQCFSCKQLLELNKFDIDRRKYQVKSDKGTCKVCIDCEYKKALENMSVIRFDFENDKFITIEFNSIDEVNKFFKKQL